MEVTAHTHGKEWRRILTAIQIQKQTSRHRRQRRPQHKHTANEKQIGNNTEEVVCVSQLF